VLCKLNLLVRRQTDTHNKLQYGNKYNHLKILDVVSDLNYIYFFNPNPTHLHKH